MDPKDALRHIRTLIKTVAKVDDTELIHRHLKDILVLVEKGLADTCNVVPMRRDGPTA